ncbi:MAG: hypothetical protein HOP29_08945 [Phycisphaerales bacterium]|nr:hypothetical protein [Phycisphaerales bacterium]
MERRTEFIAKQALARLGAKRDASKLRRCANCGLEYTHIYEPRCPRCDAALPAEHVTSDDGTPFAEAERRDRRAVRAMRRWVYSAGAERIRYLSLIRRSHASRSFARRHLLLMALALTISQMTHVGWHRVIRTVDNATHVATAPTGRGWVNVVGDVEDETVYGLLAVWYNPILSGVAALVSAVTGLLLVYGSVGVLNVGAGRWLGDAHCGQGRLRGAIDYGTAWTMPVVYAGLLFMILPIRDVMGIALLIPVPPRSFILGAAAVATGCGLLSWWFYGVRVAMTVPAAVRTRVAFYYAFLSPLLISLLAAVWFVGLKRLFEFFGSLFKLNWLGP